MKKRSKTIELGFLTSKLTIKISAANLRSQILGLKSQLGFVAILFFLLSCSRDYQPKPKGYNRLILPEEKYQHLPDTLPYQFEYSTSAKLLRDTSWINERNWVEVYYPDLRANLHITYKKINQRGDLLKAFFDDSYKLTSKQQIKAYGIDEVKVITPLGKTAMIAEISGDVPTQFQFTITDSTKNFLRGALYFNTEVNNDSLAPAIDFMKKEAMHLINTLQWRK
jgi:gliding motility-associated lipoprotein GldD